MGLTVTRFDADTNDDIISVDWVYTNSSGNISGTHYLFTPAGDFALSEVTQAVLVLWLDNQLDYPSTAFDTAIAGDIARAAYEAGLSTYTRESDNTYAI